MKVRDDPTKVQANNSSGDMGNRQSWCVNNQKSFKDKSSFVQKDSQLENATKVISESPAVVVVREEPQSLIRSLNKTTKVNAVLCNLYILQYLWAI